MRLKPKILGPCQAVESGAVVGLYCKSDAAKYGHDW